MATRVFGEHSQRGALVHTWRFDWRYTAAGFGWGIAVGILTGAVFAVLAVIGAVGQGFGGFSGAMALVLAPFMGAVVGVLPGALVGFAAGLATSVTVGGTLDRQRAWWTALSTTATVGMAVSFAASSLVDHSLTVTPSTLVLGVPVLLGAYLMARTSRSVIKAAEQRAVGAGV